MPFTLPLNSGGTGGTDAASTKLNLGLDQLSNTSDTAKAQAGNPIGDAIASKLPSSFTAPGSTKVSSPYLSFYEKIYANQYCIGNDSNDNTLAFLAMANQANNAYRGAEIVLDGSLYRVSQEIVFNKQVTISGKGKVSSRILGTTANRNILTFLTDGCVHLEGFWIQQASQAGTDTSGSLVKITGAPTINFRSSISDMRLQGGWMGIDTTDTGILTVTNTDVIDYIYGMRIQNTYNGDNGDFGVINCNFDGITSQSVQSEAGILQHSAGGLRLVSTKIVNGKRGYCMQLKDIGRIDVNATTILIIDGCSIEGQTVANVDMSNFSGVTNAHFSMVSISGGEFALFGGATGKNIWIHGDYKWLDTVNISPGVMQVSQGNTGLDINNVDNVNIGSICYTGGYQGAGALYAAGVLENFGPNVGKLTRQSSRRTQASSIAARIVNQSPTINANDEEFVYHSAGSTSSGSDNICDIYLIDNPYAGCIVEVMTEGLVQNVGTVALKSTITITRSDTSVGATVSLQAGTTSNINHVCTVGSGSATNTVRIYCTFATTSNFAANQLRHQVKVYGSFMRLAPL